MTNEYTIPDYQIKLAEPKPNNIIFYNSDGGKQVEVLRISKEGVTTNPDVPTDEAADAVIRALDSYIKGLTKREWVNLTYTEQEEIVLSAHSIRDAINKTDAKLKEKNARLNSFVLF